LETYSDHPFLSLFDIFHKSTKQELILSTARIVMKAEEAASWLQEKPDTVNLDSNHFTVLDDEAINRDILLYKIGDQKIQDHALSFS
jgi:hypothetical protein